MISVDAPADEVANIIDPQPVGDPKTYDEWQQEGRCVSRGERATKFDGVPKFYKAQTYEPATIFSPDTKPKKEDDSLAPPTGPIEPGPDSDIPF